MIEFVDLAHADELDRFVMQPPNCHFMQTSAWGRVKDDWNWYGIICRDAQRTIRGTMALLRHNIRGLHTCILYAPRGPIFDPQDSRTFRKLIAAAKELAYQCGAYVLRMDPMFSEEDTEFYDFVSALGFVRSNATDYSLFQPRMCYVLALSGASAETIDLKYHRKTRYNIHLAQRRGLTVTIGGAADLDDFYDLMQKTGANSGFEPRSRTYYERVYRQLREHTRLYLAQRDGKTIAAAMAVTMGNRAWYMFGASDPNDRRDHPNELLQWHMHRDAIFAGCTYFDLRGVEGYPTEGNPKLGLHLFKKGFSADFHAYIGQLDYVLRPGIAKMVEFYGKLSRRIS